MFTTTCQTLIVTLGKIFWGISDMASKRGGPRRTPQRSTPQRSTPQREQKQNPDDGVDISYVGANIPSKSFQFLQQSMSHPAQTSSAGKLLISVLWLLRLHGRAFSAVLQNMPP